MVLSLLDLSAGTLLVVFWLVLKLRGGSAGCGGVLFLFLTFFTSTANCASHEDQGSVQSVCSSHSLRMRSSLGAYCTCFSVERAECSASL